MANFLPDNSQVRMVLLSYWCVDLLLEHVLVWFTIESDSQPSIAFSKIVAFALIQKTPCLTLLKTYYFLSCFVFVVHAELPTPHPITM